MELELGLAPPNNPHHMIEELDLNSGTTNEAAHHAYNGQAQPLYLGSGQPELELELDPDPKSDHYYGFHTHFHRPQKWQKLHHQLGNSYEYDEEEGEIEGWPPIKHGNCRNEEHDEHDDGGATSGDQRKYVKVKMEGVTIGRKIDVTLYHSYQSLTVALINMFAKYGEITADNRILYKDREGDWMLLGDVPWEMFIESVQRMEILKTRAYT